MKKNIAEEINAFMENATLVPENKFVSSDGNAMRVRSVFDLKEDFAINDIISIPRDFQVYSVQLPAGCCLCIRAIVTSIDGSQRNIWFCPNSLAKTILPIDDNGHRLEKVKTTGKVAKWYASQGTVDQAMEILAGNELLVVDKSIFYIRDFATKDLQTTAIYSYEWRSNTLRTTKDNIRNQIHSMINYLLNDRLPQETSKHLKDGDECIIRFKFIGEYGDETFFKQDYTLNNIKVQLPLDFEKNMESWVSHIYKRRNYYIQTLFFEYKLDFYNKMGERVFSIIDNSVNGHAFVNWD